MSIGERIRFFRRLRGLTQKELGMKLGFSESSADVRLAQYETGSRCPKAELTQALARTLEVSPRALTVPNTDSLTGLMHTLFALEDQYGLEICREGERVFLSLRPGQQTKQLQALLSLWADQAEHLHTGELSRADYDFWRYHYPEQRL